MELSKRKLAILSAVVKGYSETGEPVGSKLIASMLPGQISSATIRAEMSELCELGYLEQPHTSAGRIPTSGGYRLYIEKLMPRQALTAIQQKAIDDMLPGPTDGEKIIDHAAKNLASLTGLATVSTTPMGDDASLIKAEVILMGKTTALVIAVSNGGVIKNKVCRCDLPISDDMLVTFHRLVDKFIIGRPIPELSRAAAQTIAACGGEYLLELTPLIVALFELIIEFSRTEIKLSGQSNLLSLKEYDGIRGKAVLDFLSDHNHILPLLACFNDSVGVVFGGETDIGALTDSSMVLARYTLDSKPIGKIGIIGPSRMDYSALIPCISYFAEKLGELLSEAKSDMEGEK